MQNLISAALSAAVVSQDHQQHSVSSFAEQIAKTFDMHAILGSPIVRQTEDTGLAYCTEFPDACPESVFQAEEESVTDLKAPIHALTWTALFQTLFNLFSYTLLDGKAYRDYHGESKSNERKMEDYFNLTDNEHMTYELTRWRNIGITTAATWLPMLIFGMVGLSDVLPGFVSFWIDIVLSNLTIPVLLYNIYEVLGIAVDSGETLQWYYLFTYIGIQLAVFFIQTILGAQAMEALKPNDYNNDLMFPSLFYLLDWLDRTETTD